MFTSRIKETLQTESGLEFELAWGESTEEWYANIEHTLVELLQKGELELTDPLFFELIYESPAYLTLPLFQKRIEYWQMICRSAEAANKDKDAARERLHYLGEVLAETGRGPKQNYNKMVLQCEYAQTLEWCSKIWLDCTINNTPRELREERIQSAIEDCILTLREQQEKPEQSKSNLNLRIQFFERRQQTIRKAFSEQSFNKPESLAKAFVVIECQICERTLKNAFSSINQT